ARALHSFPSRRSSDLAGTMTGTGNTKLTGWIGWMIGALGLAGVAVVGVNMLKVAGEVDARAEAREAAAVDHGMRLLGEVAAGDRSEEHTSELQSRENL